MGRFNVSTQPTKTINRAGGEAYTQNPQLHFVSLLLTSFVTDQYYRSADETLKEVSQLIDAIPDKKFTAKAAIYARTKYGMRSISHVVAAEVANRVKGEAWIRSFLDKVVYRPDDITEIMAYYKALSGKRQSHAMRKGFAAALGRFDAYKLAKYKGAGKDISLIDVTNLTHPKHTEPLGQLIKGTLPTPDTWEAKLTQAGQKATSDEEKVAFKKEVWTQLIKERKIGYFALLRNLRNILEQAPELVPDAISLLTDEKLIRSSLVLPFRFLTAMEEIEQCNGLGVREVLGGLSIAIDIATSNVPKLDGDTLVVLDGSGSMSGKPIKIGSLFAAVLIKANNADYMTFSDDAKYQTYNPMDSTMTIARMMEKGIVSGGTNFHAIFETANRDYDRVIILSDMQGWVGYNAPTQSFAEYKRRVGVNPRIYSFDLQGYGSLQFPEDNVYCLAGFSEKVFDILKLLETDKQALLHEIEKIEL